MSQVLETTSGQSASLTGGTGLCPSGSTATLTLMGWAKGLSHGSQYIRFGGQGDFVNITNNRGYMFYLGSTTNTDGFLGCYFMNNAIEVPQVSFTHNFLTWNHYAVTFSAANNRATFYVNFVQAGAVQTVTIDPSVSTSHYAFSGNFSGFLGTAPMRFQDCRMYNIELTASQITDIGNNPCAAPGAGCVSQWLFNGNTNDSVGSNNLTSNTGTFVSDPAFVCSARHLLTLGVGQ